MCVVWNLVLLVSKQQLFLLKANVVKLSAGGQFK